HVRVQMTDADGVAVGRRARDALNTQAAARSSDVFLDDRLPERFLHTVAQNASDGVGRAARRGRRYDGDRTRWPSLGARCGAGESDEKRSARDPRSHDALCHWPLMLAALMIGHHLAASAFWNVSSAAALFCSWGGGWMPR